MVSNRVFLIWAVYPNAYTRLVGATPRTVVPAGSVGIGGAQTGIYPFSSPGGWQLIGHTKLALFDKNQAQPTLLQAGDTVKFVVEGIEL